MGVQTAEIAERTRRSVRRPSFKGAKMRYRRPSRGKGMISSCLRQARRSCGKEPEPDFDLGVRRNLVESSSSLHTPDCIPRKATSRSFKSVGPYRASGAIRQLTTCPVTSALSFQVARLISSLFFDWRRVSDTQQLPGCELDASAAL